MSDPRWFKLLVRAIGLLLLGLSFPTLGGLFPFWAGALQGDTFGRALTGREIAANSAYTLGVLLQAGFGVYLLLGAPRLVRYCVMQAYSRCAACDYDLRGASGVCPECGVPVAPTPPKSPT